MQQISLIPIFHSIVSKIYRFILKILSVLFFHLCIVVFIVFDIIHIKKKLNFQNITINSRLKYTTLSYRLKNMHSKFFLRGPSLNL